MMDLLDQVEKQRRQIKKLNTQLSRLEGTVYRIQEHMKDFENTERHAILQAQVAAELAFDQQSPTINLLQHEMIALLEEKPQGLTTKQLVESRICPESRIYKLFAGIKGTLSNPAPDGLLRLEPRTRTAVRAMKDKYNRIVNRRFYWIEPKKQKLIKHPPAKI
jgi:hypothetical protein